MNKYFSIIIKHHQQKPISNIQFSQIRISIIQNTPILIDECEEEGFDWNKTYLNPVELERTKPGDIENDVEKKLD